MDFAVGRGGAEPGEGVELAPLMDALFEGDPPPLEPGALSELPAVPEQRYWLLQELQALLERAALKRPILLALDDLQWADAGTATALRVLTSRLSGLPIAWVIALRPPQGSSRISSTAGYLDRAGAERIVLGPLDQAAVVQIGRDLTGGAPDDSLVALMGGAQGSPFLLTELLTGLLDEERVRVEDGEARVTDSRLPARVHASMRERLGGLSDAARESAVLAASLGRTFSFDELATMLERPPSAVLAPVEELIDSSILVDREGDLEFRHDITRDAVRESVPSSVRRALDRQAVDVLLENGAQPGEVAAQLAESAVPGDEAAVATLSNAARILGANDPSAGADLGRRALELVPALSRAAPSLWPTPRFFFTPPDAARKGARSSTLTCEARCPPKRRRACFSPSQGCSPSRPTFESTPTAGRWRSRVSRRRREHATTQRSSTTSWSRAASTKDARCWK